MVHQPPDGPGKIRSGLGGNSDLMLEGDEAGAEKAIIEALALNPNYATAHQWYTNLLMGQGRFDQALVEIRLAQALDPLSPVIESTLGGALMANRRYAEAP